MMIVLGISGGIDMEYDFSYVSSDRVAHDSAAALLVDGEVKAAIEEERLNRIKHSDKVPLKAIRFCLESMNLQFKDVEKIAIFGTEEFLNYQCRQYYFSKERKEDFIDIRTRIKTTLEQEFGSPVRDEQLVFCNHHLAHALSAFSMSGFERSLILTIDGIGDNISGMVLQGNGNDLKTLITIPVENSLGWYYVDVISYLGFREFDEYKVMGLAPYGNPQKNAHLFNQFYRLLPQGNYAIDTQNIHLFLPSLGLPTRKAESSLQLHQDLAASLQVSLENIILHVLKHYQKETQNSCLCLAGGVAHNCSCNGKILYSGLFDRIFVQPAAHDAGTAIGSALYVFYKQQKLIPHKELEHVYWGTTIGNDDTIAGLLTPWRDYIEFDRWDNIEVKTAELLAKGAVVGWAQGRSEFGPRALGNRSILADPRPAKNKDIINEMVKKREAFRPFAPSILEEYVEEYYDLPGMQKHYPFMTFVVKVKEAKQKLLGAVTHIDGTARIQTVSRNSNPVYWRLIDEFRKITGVPILLNTSFNNNVEPIVDSEIDALVCFLTTQIQYLIIGNYLIVKKNSPYREYLKLIPRLPVSVVLQTQHRHASLRNIEVARELVKNYNDNYRETISPELDSILQTMDGSASCLELIQKSGIKDELIIEQLAVEIFSLWSKRYLSLLPGCK
ncbi:MAG TPA: carbamoyltransferase C-terminal domain-containing protein [Bacillota bacterium]|nr:carbamoyltransferase C-terminal domain-containing protein [Bacillota bacterium]